jgi:hypothetical protein
MVAYLWPKFNRTLVGRVRRGHWRLCLWGDRRPVWSKTNNDCHSADVLHPDRALVLHARGKLDLLYCVSISGRTWRGWPCNRNSSSVARVRSLSLPRSTQRNCLNVGGFGNADCERVGWISKPNNRMEGSIFGGFMRRAFDAAASNVDTRVSQVACFERTLRRSKKEYWLGSRIQGRRYS